MAMSAEDIAHPAYAYLDADITLIPITPGAKTPAVDLLPNKQWRGYQSRHSTPEEVAAWLRADPSVNWAAVCGGGLGCGDVDDPHASAWVLAHPNHPVLQGACIVRSGRGKCHVWFRYTTHLASTTWRLLPGRKMGEIRAEGNYVLVPPSALTGYEPYQRMAGSFVTLPTIVDPDRYLESIVAAYREDNPEQSGVEPTVGNKRVLILDAAQADAVVQRIRLVGFKKKILDTLFAQGKQSPGSGHWERVDSNSEIDFAVCCEFIRKGWAFDDIEEVFASTLVGHACYRDTNRANHGQGYLFRTYEASRKQVEEEAAAARQARGANFEVVSATGINLGDDRQLALVLRTPQGAEHSFRITMRKMASEARFVEECSALTGFWPEFHANQMGRAFRLFAASVTRMVTEWETPPEVVTEPGRLAAEIRSILGRIPDRGQPQTSGDATSLGWKTGNLYWIRLLEVSRRLDSARVRGTSPQGMLAALSALGDWEEIWWSWPDRDPERVIALRIQRLRPA